MTDEIKVRSMVHNTVAPKAGPRWDIVFAPAQFTYDFRKLQQCSPDAAADQLVLTTALTGRAYSGPSKDWTDFPINYWKDIWGFGFPRIKESILRLVQIGMLQAKDLNVSGATPKLYYRNRGDTRDEYALPEFSKEDASDGATEREDILVRGMVHQEEIVTDAEDTMITRSNTPIVPPSDHPASRPPERKRQGPKATAKIPEPPKPWTPPKSLSEYPEGPERDAEIAKRHADKIRRWEKEYPLRTATSLDLQTRPMDPLDYKNHPNLIPGQAVRIFGYHKQWPNSTLALFGQDDSGDWLYRECDLDYLAYMDIKNCTRCNRKVAPSARNSDGICLICQKELQ